MLIQNSSQIIIASSWENYLPKSLIEINLIEILLKEFPSIYPKDIEIKKVTEKLRSLDIILAPESGIQTEAYTANIYFTSLNVDASKEKVSNYDNFNVIALSEVDNSSKDLHLFPLLIGYLCIGKFPSTNDFWSIIPLNDTQRLIFNNLSLEEKRKIFKGVGLW